MADKTRGTVEFTLDGETYSVRPTFKILSEVEGVVGGVLSFLARLQRSDFRVTEIVNVVQICLRNQPGAPKFNAIPDLVLAEEGGIITFVMPISELLTNAITGGEKPADEGNAKTAKREAAE